MTLLLLMGLWLALAKFHKTRIRFTEPANAGSPPVVHRGQEFLIQGFVEYGNNVYRQGESVVFYLFAKDPKEPGREVPRSSNFADFDRLSSRFTGRLRVNEGEDSAFLFVRIGLYDNSYMYGPGLRRLAGNELKVRVE
jgi:hypothetical protein